MCFVDVIVCGLVKGRNNSKNRHQRGGERGERKRERERGGHSRREMARWLETLFLLLHSALLASFSQADLQCRCTTSECQAEGKDTCQAQYFCYVQYMAVSSEVRPDIPVLTRGCIDRKTPLMCENRRPHTVSGPWPVLLCCKEDHCNEDAIPTNPPWGNIQGEDREEQRQKHRQTNAGINPDNYNSDREEQDHRGDAERQEDEEEEERDFGANHEEDDGDNGKGEFTHFSHEQDSEVVQNPSFDDNSHSSSSSRRSSSSKDINPLYIGVPVAGACILLAIIIFAIYILRRQNQYMDEYHYHENLKQHQQQHHYHHPHQHPCIAAQNNRTGYPVRVAANPRYFGDGGGDQGGRKTHSPYPDSERSSSGSETKLLMKV